MRVLLVEHDRPAAAHLAAILQKENCGCHVADPEQVGLNLGRLHDYDIILLDLRPPDIDGYELLRRLRAGRVRTSILMLSGQSELGPKIKGLGFGADDVLTDPFDRRQLIARIHAIVRRARGYLESTVRTGKLVVNLDARAALVNDKPVHLTGKEYGLLELLSLRKGTIATKEMLLNHLYGGMDEPELRIIDAFVGKLRKKLVQATGGEHHIETVWGRGYVLRDPSDPAGDYGLQWTPSRKADVVAEVTKGEITIDDALRRYQLSEEEFLTWQRLYEQNGVAGLRATRAQQYRGPQPRVPWSRR